MFFIGERMGENADEDAVSPRTLRQAAEQLAKYTSAEEGGAPSDQWGDFFRYPSLVTLYLPCRQAHLRCLAVQCWVKASSCGSGFETTEWRNTEAVE